MSTMVRNEMIAVSHGSEKMKKPMSLWKCGSSTPNGTWLRQARNSRHWLDNAAPASAPTMTGTTMVSTRRNGSIASRYCSSVSLPSNVS